MKYFLSLFFFLCFATFGFADEKQITLNWNSFDGIKRLESSQHKNDFYQLVNYFQPQINPLYCSAASSVMILNAISGNGKAPSQKDLEVQLPKALGDGKIEFKSYSQLTFFNEQTDKIKDRKIIDLKNITLANENDAKNFDPGLTIDELEQILSKVYHLKVKKIYVDKIKPKLINKFREQVKQILVDEDQYLVINFYGKILGFGVGHFSPAVAFDEKSDSVLVMDVSGHNRGWYWVEIADLMKAMNTKDGNHYRGYLIIHK